MNKTLIFFFLFLIFCNSSSAQKSTDFKALIYNVENLFDTIDDPLKDDSEYLPSSKKQWNTQKFKEKLSHIGQIITETGYPELVGLCEIENRNVLEGLLETEALKGQRYSIVQIEGPDERGIDNALLIKGKRFQILSQKAISVILANEKPKPTRDILYVKVLFKKDTLHVFVNHWPSRRGGESVSEPNRIKAAQTLKQFTDSIFGYSPNSKMLVMGDLNDYPTSKSLKEILQASLDPSIGKRSGFVNLSAPFFAKGEGSEYFEGKWTMLINVIVSSSFLKASRGLKANSIEIFKPDYLLYVNKKSGEASPSRTYVGDKYVGGYSDHLPVVLKYEWKK